MQYAITLPRSFENILRWPTVLVSDRSVDHGLIAYLIRCKVKSHGRDSVDYSSAWVIEEHGTPILGANRSTRLGSFAGLRLGCGPLCLAGGHRLLCPRRAFFGGHRFEGLLSSDFAALPPHGAHNLGDRLLVHKVILKRIR